jgi:hypothetical protein
MIGILLTREDHIAFLQKKAIHKKIHPKSTKSISIHLMSITNKGITSYLAYYNDQSIERRTSLWHMIQMQSIIQRCKHDMIHKWKCNMNMYINPPNQCSKRWGPCVVRGPVDGRFLVWWVIDNVVWTNSWLSIAGAGCGLTHVGAGEEQAWKVVAREASRCGEDK